MKKISDRIEIKYAYKKRLKQKSFYQEMSNYFTTLDESQIKDCFEYEVESKDDFKRNVQETADSLELDYDLCLMIIKDYLISILKFMNILHICKVKINIFSIMYLESFNHVMNKKSSLYCLSDDKIDLLKESSIVKIMNLKSLREFEILKLKLKQY